MLQLEKTLLEEIRDFLTIPSITSDSRELQRALDKAKTAIDDFTVEVFDGPNPSLLAYKNASRPKTFDVILNGHIDVVPAPKEQFSPYVEGDRLHARGALDMKASVWVMLDVFKKIAKTSLYNIGLQLVSDEEIGGTNGTKRQINAGVRSKFVIGGEFTNLSVATSAKGVYQFILSSLGKNAHSAYPCQGDNALHRLVAGLTRLIDQYPNPEIEAWQTTLNITKIGTSNTAINVLPSEASATIDVRYIRDDPFFSTGPQAVKEFLRKINPKLKIELLFYETAHYCNSQNSHVQKLVNVIKSHRGKTKFIQKHGASDMRFYSDLGIPSVLFGPGGAGMHQSKEYVSLSSLAQFHTILIDYLTSLDLKNK